MAHSVTFLSEKTLDGWPYNLYLRHMADHISLPITNFPNFPQAARRASELVEVHNRPVDIVSEDGDVIRTFIPRLVIPGKPEFVEETTDERIDRLGRAVRNFGANADFQDHMGNHAAADKLRREQGRYMLELAELIYED